MDALYVVALIAALGVLAYLVDVLLLDKTGTITLGNRQASAFVAAPGVGERDCGPAACRRRSKKFPGAARRLEILAGRDGDRVEIVVADNGPGLPAGKEEALFEKFARGHEESAVAGVGLGLASVRAIVEVHRGTVRAENRPEGGARFVISLPVGEPPSVPEET